MKRDTGLTGIGGPLFEGDKVMFCEQEGEIVFECGTFGIATQEMIDYDEVQACMDDLEDICCGNSYSGCKNDNFISLWEIYWNFNCEDDYLWVVSMKD